MLLAPLISLFHILTHSALSHLQPTHPTPALSLFFPSFIFARSSPCPSLRQHIMASKATVRLPIAFAKRTTPSLSLTARRSLVTSRPNQLIQSSKIATRSQPIRQQTSRSALQQSFRRSYADVAPKRRKAGFFRWTWRLTYLSTIGGLGYLAYLIYDLRTPDEQYEPDSKKKTLVILGISRGPLLWDTN